MQMCPNCDRVYDESEYCHCPYCSGELEPEEMEWYDGACPNCGGSMYRDDDYWVCSNCEEEIPVDEDDSD